MLKKVIIFQLLQLIVVNCQEFGHYGGGDQMIGNNYGHGDQMIGNDYGQQGGVGHEVGIGEGMGLIGQGFGGGVNVGHEIFNQHHGGHGSYGDQWANELQKWLKQSVTSYKLKPGEFENKFSGKVFHAKAPLTVVKRPAIVQIVDQPTVITQEILNVIRPMVKEIVTKNVIIEQTKYEKIVMKGMESLAKIIPPTPEVLLSMDVLKDVMAEIKRSPIGS